MKKHVLLTAMVIAALSLNAQTEVSHGFNAGSKTENGVSAVVGQPFGSITEENGYEVTEGVVQAQLTRKIYSATVEEGEGYEGHGFSFPASNPEGEYEATLYTLGGGGFSYDLLEKMKLRVIKAFLCGGTVYDVDDNPYTTVSVAGYCWTQQNLKPLHYPGVVTAIDGAMDYSSTVHPDAVANVGTYGRLYTWAAAVRASADGSLTPDADGHVQGICPDGWHIPTAEEMAALKALPAEEIRTAELWVQPNSNTNSTEFTALPAGIYKAETNRFEDLGSKTDWWSIADGATTPASLSVVYYCDSSLDGTSTAQDGLSVRCVKN